MKVLKTIKLFIEYIISNPDIPWKTYKDVAEHVDLIKSGKPYITYGITDWDTLEGPMYINTGSRIHMEVNQENFQEALNMAGDDEKMINTITKEVNKQFNESINRVIVKYDDTFKLLPTDEEWDAASNKDWE